MKIIQFVIFLLFYQPYSGIFYIKLYLFPVTRESQIIIISYKIKNKKQVEETASQFFNEYKKRFGQLYQ